jgi:hypothetical protein
MACGALLFSRPGATWVVMLLAVLACGLCTLGEPDDRVATILVAEAPVR